MGYTSSDRQIKNVLTLTLPQNKGRCNQWHDTNRRSCCRKGGMNALDDFCSTCDTLAVGAGERLHDWRIHSYFACHCNRCGADQNNFGTQTLLTGGIKEGNPGTKGEDKNRFFRVC